MPKRLRTLSAVSLSLLCSACGDRAVKACEAFIAEGLRSPSSYRRVEVNDSLKKLTPDPKAKSIVDRMQGYEREILITYDAPNAFGVPIRGMELCTFDAHENGDMMSGLDPVSLGKSFASNRNFRISVARELPPGEREEPLKTAEALACCKF